MLECHSLCQCYDVDACMLHKLAVIPYCWDWQQHHVDVTDLDSDIFTTWYLWLNELRSYWPIFQKKGWSLVKDWTIHQHNLPQCRFKATIKRYASSFSVASTHTSQQLGKPNIQQSNFLLWLPCSWPQDYNIINISLWHMVDLLCYVCSSLCS